MRVIPCFVVVALSFTVSTAFSVGKPTTIGQHITAARRTSRQVLLSDDETEEVLKAAEECSSRECSEDEIDELLSVLKETAEELENRLDRCVDMVDHLQHINSKEERATPEVRQFVKDLLAALHYRPPTSYPTGYSGEVGDGPKTAYDVLSPKKWHEKEE